MTALELYRFAENREVPVFRFALPENGSVSLQYPGGKCMIGIDDMPTSADETVHLGHELGHTETGSFYSEMSCLDLRQRHENRADRWAIQKLIPVCDFDQAVGSGLTEVWQLADFFNVTEEFMRKAICLYLFGNVDADEFFPA